jgi:hypothetical protein
MAGKGIIGGLVTLVIVYLLFDFFFWGGGLVQPPILERMNESLSAF